VTAPTLSPEGSDTLRCARHPNTETVLRCGRCDTPICPRCQIQTPVGARCPTCARVKRFATLLKPREVALGVVYGVGAATLGTIVLGFIPFLGLIGFALLGFGVGEAVSVGANRKRARELAPLAVACFLLGYEIGSVAAILIASEGRVLLSPSLVMAPIFGLTRGLGVLAIALGAFLAWMRAR
jgi:uncharacterized membrane protein